MKRFTLVLMCILGAIQLLMVAGNLWGGGMTAYFIGVAVIAAAVYGAGALLVVRIRRMRKPDARSALRSSADLHDIWNWRVLVVLGLAFVGANLLIMFVGPLGSLLLMEGSYYLLFVAAGIALAAWARAKGYVPVLGATLILLADSIWEMAMFSANPDVRFRFGPETALFAMQTFIARLNMLPLDIVVLYTAWRVPMAKMGYGVSTSDRQLRKRPVLNACLFGAAAALMLWASNQVSRGGKPEGILGSLLWQCGTVLGAPDRWATRPFGIWMHLAGWPSLERVVFGLHLVLTGLIWGLLFYLIVNKQMGPAVLWGGIKRFRWIWVPVLAGMVGLSVVSRAQISKYESATAMKQAQKVSRPVVPPKALPSASLKVKEELIIPVDRDAYEIHQVIPVKDWKPVLLAFTASQGLERDMVLFDVQGGALKEVRRYDDLPVGRGARGRAHLSRDGEVYVSFTGAKETGQDGPTVTVISPDHPEQRVLTLPVWMESELVFNGDSGCWVAGLFTDMEKYKEGGKPAQDECASEIAHELRIYAPAQATKEPPVPTVRRACFSDEEGTSLDGMLTMDGIFHLLAVRYLWAGRSDENEIRYLQYNTLTGQWMKDEVLFVKGRGAFTHTAAMNLSSKDAVDAFWLYFDNHGIETDEPPDNGLYAFRLGDARVCRLQSVSHAFGVMTYDPLEGSVLAVCDVVDPSTKESDRMYKFAPATTTLALFLRQGNEWYALGSIQAPGPVWPNDRNQTGYALWREVDTGALKLAYATRDAFVIQTLELTGLE